MIVFETNNKIDKWVEKHKKDCITNGKPQFIYKFLPIPGSECVVQEVKCTICKKKKLII